MSAAVSLQSSFLGYKNEREYLSIRDRNNEIFKKIILNNPLYSKLYSHPIFEEYDAPPSSDFYGLTLSDINIDRYKITKSDEKCLATTGVTTCFAICFRGKNKLDQTYRGLYHYSNVYPLNSVLLFLKAKLVYKGCSKDSIEFYILGGRIVGDAPDYATLKFMKESLSIAEKMNICGIRFNHSIEPESNFQILFTADKIYYSSQDFFHAFEE